MRIRLAYGKSGMEVDLPDRLNVDVIEPRYTPGLFEAKDPAALLERIRTLGAPIQDMWQAQIHARICANAEVHLFSHNLSDDQISRALLKPCRDVAGTVDRLLGTYGPKARIAALPEGPLTLPTLSARDANVGPRL